MAGINYNTFQRKGVNYRTRNQWRNTEGVIPLKDGTYLVRIKRYYIGHHNSMQSTLATYKRFKTKKGAENFYEKTLPFKFKIGWNTISDLNKLIKERKKEKLGY